MAQRPWLVRPDHEVDSLVDRGDGTIVAGEPIQAVSQQALASAMVEGAVMLSRAGGVFEVVVNRAATGCGGEMVTTLASCRWKDRTDARPQPEPEGGPIRFPAVEPEAVARELVGVAPDAEAIEGNGAVVGADGADESSVPEEFRGV